MWMVGGSEIVDHGSTSENMCRLSPLVGVDNDMDDVDGVGPGFDDMDEVEEGVEVELGEHVEMMGLR